MLDVTKKIGIEKDIKNKKRYKMPYFMERILTSILVCNNFSIIKLLRK